MGDERRKILEMLSKGKISVDEAERLLKAIGESDTPGGGSGSGKKPKYLHVRVEPTPESKEGDILSISIDRDTQETEAAKERVSALLEKLKNKNMTKE